MFKSLLAAGIAALALTGCAAPSASTAAACAADPAHWARGTGGCLAIQSVGAPRADLLVVVLHGDVSGGGPASYHVAFARRVAEALPGAAVMALVRPGYADAGGRTSDGDLNNRMDHVTPANLQLVSDAVGELRRRTGARRVVAIGHSSGATTAADILALHPRTIDAAILLACPCDLARWRAGRTPWLRSVSPISVADQVPREARVAAYTGSADTNTDPALARAYVEKLRGLGVPATFEAVPGATHNGVVDAVWSTDFPRTLRSLAGSG